ncbi:exodeoxyribonuclease V subunit gamma [Buchnera aphidicola (Neophyllaphis varicolor)]|uniref:exodeoxyribonuclease V subunit gamma n=1 Tax=Buchnera aphidicola TaxID=9 RepID=UPI0031B80BBF
MFNIYYSNQLNILIKKIDKVIKKKPAKNLLKPEIILVPSTKLIQPIQILITKHIGICANIEIMLFKNFLLKYFNIFFFKRIFLDDELLTWKLFSLNNFKKIVKDNKEIKEKEIINYELQNFSLAKYIAKLFKQYMLYDPLFLEKISNKKKINSQYIWQIKLWKCIFNKKNKNNKESFNTYNFFEKEILKSKKNKLIPKRFFLCCINFLEPIYIIILKILNKYSDIYILISNSIFYNKKTTNFTESKIKGKIFKTISLAEQNKNIFISKLKCKNIKEKKFFIRTEKNILNTIKKEILNKKFNSLFNGNNINKKEIKENNTIELEDSSFCVKATNNIREEIEKLCENIKKILNKKNDILPHEIIVMSNNIKKYSHIIKSVFKKNFKVKIIDEKFSDKSILFNNFYKLMKLGDSQLSNIQIIEFLEMDSISKKFKINQEEYKLLYKWIKELGVQWGFDQKHINKKINLKNININTWKIGIKKILLGYAMDQDNIFDNIIPYYEPNNLFNRLIEKFIILLIKLNKWRKIFQKPKTIKYWIKKYQKFTSDFFDKKEDSKKELKLIEKTWKKILYNGLKSKNKDKISINLLREEILNNINKKSNNHIIDGSICFSNINYLSYFPFKVICIIGLNQKFFIKTTIKNKYYFLVDSIKKINNNLNYLNYNKIFFLNSLISAQKIFYISYIKKNSQNIINTTSILNKLINYIKYKYYIKKKSLKENKIKKINTKKINKISKKNICYKNKYLIEKQFYNIEQIEKKISFKNLLKFWKNPIRFFFNYRLQIKNFYQIENLYENEIFQPNNLDIYKINTEILDKILYKKDINILFKKYKTNNQLPIGKFGEIIWNKQIKEMEQIAQKINNYVDINTEKYINSEIKLLRIENNYLKTYKTGLVRWRPGILNIYDGLSLWLEHLVYCLSGGLGNSIFIGKKNTKWYFSNVNKEIAFKNLKKYIKGYKEGLMIPILLTKSGEKWLSTIYNTKNNSLSKNNQVHKKAEKNLLNTWFGNFIIYGEREDIYISKIINKIDDYYINKICSASKKWLMPILKNNTNLKIN